MALYISRRCIGRVSGLRLSYFVLTGRWRTHGRLKELNPGTLAGYIHLAPCPAANSATTANPGSCSNYIASLFQDIRARHSCSSDSQHGGQPITLSFRLGIQIDPLALCNLR